jgi:hypothetical protein
MLIGTTWPQSSINKELFDHPFSIGC